MNKYLARPWHLFRRGPYFREYFRSCQARGAAPRLHVGCGDRPIAGWCNVDVSRLTDEVHFVDALKPMPFESGAFRYVFSEHFVEHLPFEGGLRFFREAHRVLAPGGVLRTATPDLAFLARLHREPEQHRRYVDYVAENFAREKPRAPATAINLMFYGWGHRFIYDAAFLEEVLRGVGFRSFRACRPGESPVPELRGLEQHGKSVPPDINEMETFVVEAAKG